MADDYLGKKMEDYLAQRPVKRTTASLGKLLLRNRSYRGFDNSFVVRDDQLRRIISVNTMIPSACNRQALRFRAVLSDEADKVLPYIRLGGALRDMKLPLAGTEPRAFIVICATVDEDHYIDIDLGISAQSMLLQAVEMGLGGICIGAFDHAAVKASLELEREPLLIVAIGRPAERIALTEIGADDDHNYYRRDGVHYVPKVRLDDLIIK